MGTRIVISLDGQIVTEVELDKPVTVVGRHPACDIVIDHPAVSGRHMLFRVVDRTVYVEDLASTNGVKVNGVATEQKVVHHLDLLEVGHHKIHFFDDDLLRGALGNLENTVLTEYERTMMAAHLPSRAEAGARRGSDDLSRTMAMPRDPGLSLGSAPEAAPAESDAARGALALRAINGERAGEVVVLNGANTVIGPTGGDNALVVRRGERYFIARFGGSHVPRLNRRDLGPGAHSIAPRDLIEVGNSRFEVVQVASR